MRSLQNQEPCKRQTPILHPKSPRRLNSSEGKYSANPQPTIKQKLLQIQATFLKSCASREPANSYEGLGSARRAALSGPLGEEDICVGR